MEDRLLISLHVYICIREMSLEIRRNIEIDV